MSEESGRSFAAGVNHSRSRQTISAKEQVRRILMQEARQPEVQQEVEDLPSTTRMLDQRSR